MADPTPEVIEAAARVLCRDDQGPGWKRLFDGSCWEDFENANWLDYADLAKEVLQAGGRTAGPGEVVVPREPTEAMLDVTVADLHLRSTEIIQMLRKGYGEMYRAMLAAAEAGKEAGGG